MKRCRTVSVAKAGVIILLLVFALGGDCVAAQKINYPTRPITFITPYGPGGSGDLLARAYADALKTILPQPLEVVNRAGGATVPGTVEVIKARPNGYTILCGSTNNLLVPPQLNPDIPFKGPQDVQNIITAGILPMVFAVGANQPWKTMRELLDYAKANPGKIVVGLVGIGGGTHIHFMHMLKVTGVSMTYVPNDSAAVAVTQILGGHAQGACLNLGPLVPSVRAGRARLLAFFLEERMKSFDPDVPTFKELGYDVITEGSTFVISAPKGTPREIIAVLYDACRKAQQTEKFQRFLKDNAIITNDRGADYWDLELQKQFKWYTGFLKEIDLMKSKKN